MESLLKKSRGIGACDFCGSPEHIFTKTTCPQYMSQHPKVDPSVVNGKTYPMWGQFVEKSDQFVGGTLEDFGDGMDRRLGMENTQTKITSIKLKPNGDDSAYFQVEGEDFSCGFDVQYGGIAGGEEGWITFSGYMGHKWRMKTSE
tara:strand:- start:38720 stop:39154 length:435 start_codon:yes stop_codon:yes gene_type:complete